MAGPASVGPIDVGSMDVAHPAERTRLVVAWAVVGLAAAVHRGMLSCVIVQTSTP
jgi:hypothetical protein